MKSKHILPAALILCALNYAAEKLPQGELALLDAVSKRTESTRVTQRAAFMPDRIAARCDIPKPEVLDRNAANPHVQKWIHVYASDKVAFTDAPKTLPAGTVVIKEKFHADNSSSGQKSELREASKPELFTVMIKRDAGFYPEGGDWEYAVVNGDASRVLARGKIESCVQCHRLQKNSDFLYRSYIKKDSR